MAKLYDVDWGDGTATETSVPLPRKHNYPSDGTYPIKATRRDTQMQGSTTIVLAANRPQISLTRDDAKPRSASLGITGPATARYTISWGDGKPPVTGTAAGTYPYVYDRKGTYTVTVTDERTKLSVTAEVSFPADFIVDWVVTAKTLGVYELKAVVKTPTAVDNVSIKVGALSLGGVTKTAPGRFEGSVLSTSILKATEPLVLTVDGFDPLTCQVTPLKASSGRCESNVLLAVRHVSNAGFLGIGRGTWLHVYAESAVNEVEVSWLDTSGKPDSGYPPRMIATWKESSNQSYMYGWTAIVKIPNTTTELRCKVGPDGMCSL